MRRVLLLAAAPVLSLAVVLVFAPSPHSQSASRTRLPSPGVVLPSPPRPVWAVPAPVALATGRGVSRWAPVRQAVIARSAPAPDAAPVAAVSARTPEGTTDILELVGRATARASGLWQRVLLAALPNGTTGWVPRSALGGSTFVDTRLVIYRARMTATLFRSEQRLFTAPIGIGQRQSPTPRGTFYVRDVLTRYASPAYGPVAFGTSARSPTLTDWPAGGYVGIHGTNRPDLVPGVISHGCIRMRNFDILRLARLMPVGTPVIVK